MNNETHDEHNKSNTTEEEQDKAKRDEEKDPRISPLLSPTTKIRYP